jgi:hypothetical protein
VCRVFFIFKESFPGFARMRVSHEDWISLKGEGHILESRPVNRIIPCSSFFLWWNPDKDTVKRWVSGILIPLSVATSASISWEGTGGRRHQGTEGLINTFNPLETKKNKTMIKVTTIFLALLVVIVLAGTSHAQLFIEDFDTYSAWSGGDGDVKSGRAQ